MDNHNLQQNNFSHRPHILEIKQAGKKYVEKPRENEHFIIFSQTSEKLSSETQTDEMHLLHRHCLIIRCSQKDNHLVRKLPDKRELWL